jgi:8-oxo-dGTP pyrophosphatase MutT (NUDIX family)
MSVLVWRRKPGGDELLQVADGKGWRLPRADEVGLRTTRIAGAIGHLAEAHAGFDPGRTHRWVRIDAMGGDVATAFRQAGATVVAWRRSRRGPEVLVLHRAGAGPGDDVDWAWTPPGGALAPGEMFKECAQRELLEETGLDLVLTRVSQPGGFAVFVAEASPEHEVVLSDEHDRSEWVSIDEACARCRPATVPESIRAAARFMEGL